MLNIKIAGMASVALIVLIGPMIAQGNGNEASVANHQEDNQRYQNAAQYEGLPSAFYWVDYDSDGRADVFALTVDGRGQLLRNHGDGTFEEVTLVTGLNEIEPSKFGLWGDWDRDGFPDVLLVGDEGHGVLWQNEAGACFRRSDYAEALVGGIQGAGWLDYDRDGWPDLYLMTESGPKLFRNMRGQGFEGVIVPIESIGTLSSDWVVTAPLFNTEIGSQVEVGGQSIPQARESDPADRPEAISPQTNDEQNGTVRNRGVQPRGGRIPMGSTGGPSAGATSAGPSRPASGIVICSSMVEDEATGVCVPLSTTPTLGKLYPLSEEFRIREGVGGAGDVRLSIASSASTGVGWTAFEILDESGTFCGAFSVRNTDKGTVHLWNASTIFLSSSGNNLTLGYDASSTIDFPGAIIDASPALALFDQVGIGTNNPGARLDVSGDGIISGDLTVAGAAGNFRSAIQQVDGTGSNIDADTVDGHEGVDLEESIEIDTKIGLHAGDPDVHHAPVTDADTVDGYHAVDLEEGPELATHASDSTAHHAPVTSVDGLSGGTIAGSISVTGAAVVAGDLSVSGASSNFRNAIRSVDGSGSGIDADSVDGLHSTDLLTGSGTSNWIALWSGANTLSASVISESSGRIGIGFTPAFGKFGVSTSGLHAIEGYTNSTSRFGVLAGNTNSSGTGIVGIGNNANQAYLNAGSGVAGIGTRYGVWGMARNSSQCTGVSGSSNNQNPWYLTSGSGLAGAGTMVGVYGRATLTSVSGQAGGYFETGYGDYCRVAYRSSSGTGYKVQGSGLVASVMPTSNGDVTLIAPESPEAWVTDFGEGRLVGGVARIDLDPTLLECVTISEEYPLKAFVQLTSQGSVGVFIEKDGTGFTVHDSLGQPSNATFDFHVVAKWRGVEQVRFEAADERPVSRAAASHE